MKHLQSAECIAINIHLQKKSTKQILVLPSHPLMNIPHKYGTLGHPNTPHRPK